MVRAHYPELLEEGGDEYRKMLELSTKMTLVGHACCEVAGFRYDERPATERHLVRRLLLSRRQLHRRLRARAPRASTCKRIELLLTTGWFDVRTDRERLFYAIVARLFAARDVLDPVLRQAIMLLFEAQKRDAELRLSGEVADLPRREQLAMLRQCARDQAGMRSPC